MQGKAHYNRLTKTVQQVGRGEYERMDVSVEVLPQEGHKERVAGRMHVSWGSRGWPEPREVRGQLQQDQNRAYKKIARPPICLWQ